MAKETLMWQEGDYVCKMRNGSIWGNDWWSCQVSRLSDGTQESNQLGWTEQESRDFAAAAKKRLT